tara:strand:+ start:46663 stop:47442 length:780 start_codon:yes stop_codon:yes gene_type:complete
MRLNIYYLLILTLSSGLFAKEFLEFGEKDFQKKIKKNNWMVDVSAQFMQYETRFPEFTGEHIKVEDNDLYDMYGINIAIGKEFYFFGDFSVGFKTALFYNENQRDETGKAAKDIDIDLSRDRTDYRMYGAQADLYLNYLIEMKSINLQPFIGTGLGLGIAEMEKRYTFDGISTATPAISAESYTADLREEFSYINTNIGISFISRTGLITTLKLTRIDTLKTNREVEGEINGTDFKTKEDDLEESVTNYMASLGVGFFF